MWFLVESMRSMVRTEMRVPAGMVTYTGVFGAATVPGSLGSKLSDCVGMSLAAVSESNLSQATSAMLYVCIDEPPWKLISLPVPPVNLPLIRLPFFSFKESADAIDTSRHTAMTNPQLSLHFITLTSPILQ